MAGHNSSGDSGVMSRFFGQMQTWLNDHTSDAFVVCTSNDITTLPAAFTRAERFDGLFYVGLPGVAQRRAIWRIYTERYDPDPQQPKPVDADFSGAEIKATCRLAALLDVPVDELMRTVREDLTFSGFFDVVDPLLYQKLPKPVQGTVVHDDWLGIGADAVVASRL